VGAGMGRRSGRSRTAALTDGDRDRPALLAWNSRAQRRHPLLHSTFYNVTAKASSGKYNNPTIDPALQARSARSAIGPVPERTEIPGPADSERATPSAAMYSALHDGRRRGRVSAPTSARPCCPSTWVSSTRAISCRSRLAVPGPTSSARRFTRRRGFVGVKYLRKPESSPGNQWGSRFPTFSNPVERHRVPRSTGVNSCTGYLSATSVPTTSRATRTPIPQSLVR